MITPPLQIDTSTQPPLITERPIENPSVFHYSENNVFPIETYKLIAPIEATSYRIRELRDQILRQPTAEHDSTDFYATSASYCRQTSPAGKVYEFILFEMKHRADSQSEISLVLGQSALLPHDSPEDLHQRNLGWNRPNHVFLSKLRFIWESVFTPGWFYAAQENKSQTFAHAASQGGNMYALSRMEFCDHRSFTLESLMSLSSAIAKPRPHFVKLTRPSVWFLHSMWYAMGRFPTSIADPGKSQQNGSQTMDEEEGHGYVPPINPKTTEKMMRRFEREISKFRNELRKSRNLREQEPETKAIRAREDEMLKELAHKTQSYLQLAASMSNLNDQIERELQESNHPTAPARQPPAPQAI